MAVSGRKLADFQGSVSQGSAEDFDQSCVPCVSDGQHIEAHGFCVDCQEYLCKNCFHCHEITKASKHHQLLDKANMDKQAVPSKIPEVCSEKCYIHKNEIIKFFCPKHEELGCHDCMIMKHRTCDLDYIPDKCEGIGDSREYMETMKKLEQKVKEEKAVIRKAAEKDRNVDDCYDKVLKDIMKFRKKINDRLDTLQTKVETEAKTKKTASKQEIQAALASLQDFATNLIKVQTLLEDCKSTKQNSQLFTEMKRAKSQLESQETEQALKSIEKTNSDCTFSHNKDLENVLSLDCFGKLTKCSVAVATPSKTISTPRENKPVNKLIHKADANVKSVADDKTCDIFSCAELSSNKHVLADWENQKLKVFNIEMEMVLEEKTLDSSPRDVAVLPRDQIAVTVPYKKEILIINTAGQLLVDHSISIKEHCYGLTYHQDRLYVVCQRPNSVLILDIKGTIRGRISLKDHVFSLPNNIVLSKDQNFLYISETWNNSVVSISLKGDILAVYKNAVLDGPMGMLMLSDGSLLVCCKRSNTIMHVTADLKQSRRVLDCLVKPYSICISVDGSEVYVGEENSDVLKVFSIH